MNIMELEIKCGFNSNDETFNFGSRGLADNESYEAVTLATVKGSDIGDDAPFINTRIQNGEIFYSINDFFGIFKDKSYSGVKFSCTFKCIVDVICISPTNSFVFIFLRDGSLQILKCNQEEYNLVDTINLAQCEELSYEKLFIGGYIENFEEDAQSIKLSVIVVTARSHIYRVNVLDAESSNISATTKLLYDLETTIQVSLYSRSLLFLKGSRMWVVDLLNDNTISTKAIDVKYACFADLNILALLHTGNLCFIDPFTLCYFPVEIDTPLQAISFLVDERSIVKCIVAQTENNKLNESYLQLLQPDFSVVYSLKISTDIQIINPESETDEVQYISLIKNGDHLDEIRFHCIHETDPEKRLFRLFRRKMFDEAERFAKTHNIEISIVNKEKAKLIVEKLNCSSKDIDDLIEILNSLSDKQFILDCCIVVESTCLNAEDILRILKYGCDLEIDKKDIVSKKGQFICNKLYVRINLFLSMGYEMNKWNGFSNACLITEMKKFLKQEEIAKAIIICSCIGKQEVETLDEANVENIINILNFLHLDVVIPFLPTFVPIILHNLPNTLPLFVNWLEMKIFLMEDQYSDNFPQNAIDFLQNTAEYFKIGNTSIVRNNEKSMITKLKKLFEALNCLKILKCNYGIKIAMSEFLQEPKAVIKTLLNLELAPNMYNLVLQEFTYKFILQNQLDPDDILWDELIDILNCQEGYWENIVGSILNCITSLTLKLEAVEKILLTAKLPWSNIVRQLGIQMLNSTYPAAFNIDHLMKKEPMMAILNKKEYCLSKYSCTDLEDLRFVANRIINCDLPNSISDAFLLCGEEETFKIEVMRLVFHQMVEKGDFEKALDVIDGNKATVEKCLELILGDITEFLEPSISENYIYALNIITEKYSSITIDEFDLFSWRKNVELLKNVHNINKYFGINVSGNLVRGLEIKKQFINDLMKKMVDNYEDGVLTSGKILESCKRLSTYTGMDKEKICLQCCMKVNVNKHELLCGIAEDFLNNSDKVKYLCILTVYLLHNFNIKSENQMVENSFIDYNNSIVNNSLKSNKNSNRIIELTLSLISKAVAISNIEELSACLKIVPWVNSIYFLKRKEISLQQKIDNSEDIVNFDPSSGSLLAIQKVFSMYTSFVAKYKRDEYRFLTYFNRNQSDISKEEFLNEIRVYERLLCVLNQDEILLSYKLLTTLQNQLMVHEDLDIIRNTLSDMIRNQYIPNLVHFSILMEDIGENLFHTSLLWFDSKEAEKHIVNALKLQRKMPNKVAVIARIGYKIFDYHKNVGPKKICIEILLTVSWWEKLKHLNLEYNTFFKATSRARLELLISNEHFNFKQIKQYCSDYNLTDIQYFYLKYLEICLLKWEPKYKVVTNNTGTKKLVMQQNQEEQLYQKCMEVKQYIEEKEKVEELLQQLWSRVNFYHYEIFTCILDISEGHSFKHLKAMLLFLKKYDRINTPSDTEKEKWFNSFPESQIIDPLSEFRLLFNNTLLDSKDIWNVIRKEISLKNYTVWFEAVQAFSYLTIDDICSFLVKELVSQGVMSAIKPGEWLYPKHTSLFTEIDNCLQHMNNVEMNKFSAAYYLLSNTPEGADQVTIAKITYRYALEYKNHEPNPPCPVSFKKIEKKYQRCLSLQILHMHQLADQCYIDLILNIEQLLMALYQDERIIKKSEYINLHCPDINKAADQLAEIFSLDIITFRKKLVSVYLVDSDSLALYGNMSMELSINLMYQDNIKKSEYNLIRAAYVCSSDVIFWRKYLLEQADINNLSESSNVYYRSRCLKCLREITDILTIEFLTSRDFESFMNIVDQLTLSSILSTFGIQLDLENMKTWSIVTKKLAQIGNPDSIKALAQVCKVLKLSKVKYWEFIIKKANHFNMFLDLKDYLEYTKNEDYIYDKFYVSAWQRLIDHTVTATLNLDDTKFEEYFLKDIFMIQQCPVLFHLNLQFSFKKCIQSDKLDAAAILMQYIPKEKALEVAKDFKRTNKLDDVLKKIKRYESFGVATSGVRSLLFN